MTELQPPPPKKGIARLIAATRYSLDGLRDTFRTEEAFRLETWVLILATPVAFWLGETAAERILLIGAILLVMIVELLNTGIEKAINRVGREYHEFSRQAKDAASAAVFVSMLFGGFIWLMILID